MLTVTNAWNQRGWSNSDHMLGHEIEDMVGRTYTRLSSLRRAADRMADRRSYPMIEYHDERGQRYRYDGSPTSIPGREIEVIRRID